MPVERANSARPATGPKMRKINLVLETGLRIEKAPWQGSSSAQPLPLCDPTTEKQILCDCQDF